MSKRELGMNPCIQVDVSGSFVAIRKVENGETEKLYLEDRTIRKFSGIVYDGPACYRARRLHAQTWEFVIKFAWRQSDEPAEEDTRALITKRNVWGVVRLYGHLAISSINELRRGLDFDQSRNFSLNVSTLLRHLETKLTLHQEGVPSDAHTASDATGERKPMMAVDRKLYCVAIHPVGRPMQDYRTPLEVLEAFRDIVKGHQSLYIDGQILHRDVSKDNIMITSNPEEGAPKGFLIDLDVSQRLDDNNPKKSGRHGTRPFMAMGVLLGKEHTYRHDLESLFYCFLWIAICGQGKAWPREGSKFWG
jgi:serine/threonine protein kinase